MSDAEHTGPDSMATQMPVVDEPGVCGLLRVSWFSEDSGGTQATRHLSTYVNGPLYSGMEDNDLRGFLDGGFLWGWNQATQAHVRVGRLFPESRAPVCPPKYGEEELFRMLQRWDGIRLPRGATVSEARLILTVERGPETAQRIMLYAVNKDWNPGGGGLEGDNASPPKRGEVWWNDVGFEEEAWGLPGVGFAARGRADADTDVMALADAMYRPGEGKVILSSDELSSYATARIADNQPLLFLLKLSDYHEDIPDSLIDFYSANYGSDYCVSRRPQLVLEWTSDCEVASIDERVHLEYGRTHVIPELGVQENALCAVSFWSDPGYSTPTVDLREAGVEGAADANGWTRVMSPFVPKSSRLDLRISAARQRITLGHSFRAEMRETWVATAPPKEQTVLWTFVAPSGLEHEVEAAYAGDFRWRVAFVPDEVGPWLYHWRHRFTAKGFKSPVGTFDVVAGDLDAVMDQLNKLAAAVESAAAGDDPDVIEELRERFYRLQRAAMLLQDPQSFQSESGVALRKLHNQIRASLSGRAIPDPMPLVSSPAKVGEERSKRSGWVTAAKRAFRSAKRLSSQLLT